MYPIKFDIESVPATITHDDATFTASRVPQFSLGACCGALHVMAPEAAINGWNARVLLVQHPEDKDLAPVRARRVWIGQLKAKPFAGGWFGDRETKHFDSAEQAVAAVLELASQSMTDWCRIRGLQLLGYDAAATEVVVEAVRPVHRGAQFLGYQTRTPTTRSLVPVESIDWMEIPAYQLGRGASPVAVAVRQ